MYYQHFLGVDVLELAARVSDAAAVTAKYEVPTMQASECVVCHKTVDPVAGVFQDYWRFATRLPSTASEKRVGSRICSPLASKGKNYPRRSGGVRCNGWASGPRRILASRPPWSNTSIICSPAERYCGLPKDLDDPLYAAKRRAYDQQRCVVEQIAARFAASNFNLKGAFKDWATSEFYRADGLTTAAADPGRRAELDDIGLMRMLTPEQLERKVGAVFGEKWGRLEGELAMLYGGIDSQEVTERATDPSGADGRDPAESRKRRRLQAHARGFCPRARMRGCCFLTSSRTWLPVHQTRRTPQFAGRSCICIRMC